MTNHANPIPSWRSYADLVIARQAAEHHAHYAARDKAQGLTATRDDHDPVDDLPPLLESEVQSDLVSDLLDKAQEAESKRHLPSDTTNTPSETDEDADDSRDVTRLPTHRLSMAIRLAATIGSEANMQRYTESGAISLITGIPPAQLELVIGLIRQQLFAPTRRMTTEPKHFGPEDTVILLAPDTRGDEITATGQQAFHRQIGRALDRAGGLILLVPDITCLPPGLQYGIPNTMRLAQLNREVLIAHLGHSHNATGCIDENALRDALPDDRLLATLPFTSLRLSLRAPTARAVAARITELCAPMQSDGPALETMAGDGPALVAARRLIADLSLWQDDKIAWTDLSRSMLLYGPPGTGKTWLARAMGNSAGIAMVESSFAIWQSAGHLGDMLREMRKSFAEARRLAPAILFIDEIDSVGSRESGDRNGSSYQRQVINGFLGELNGISRDEGVIVIGACNHPNRIDPAVLRAGRFDIKLQMPLPDAVAIRGILERHLAGEIADGELQTLATASVGRSAAEIDAAIRAARSEARHARTALSIEMVQHHLGITRDARKVATDWRSALHECGHAIVGSALGCGTITRVMLTSEGGETHRRVMTQEGLLTDIEAEIAYMLAGRAAENLILGDIASGAGGPAESDIAQATRLALAIDVMLGLGADGPVWTAAPDHELLRDPAIHARVRKRLEAAEQHALDILEVHEPLLRKMAATLQERREIGEAELWLWLSRVSPTDMTSGDPPVDHRSVGSDTSDGTSSMPVRPHHVTARSPVRPHLTD